MDTEIYDGIEWVIDSLPNTSSSGDEIDTFLYEFTATGVDDNGNEIIGTAHYIASTSGMEFSYVEYEEPEENEDEEDEDL